MDLRISELQDIIRLCNLKRCRLDIDLSPLNRIIKHRTEEFLVTVETGITFGALQQQLKNQRFPLTYHPDRTLANILAENPSSLTHNKPLPHWVVGIEAITGDGEYIHYGGEVVKNVTGYDMAKLFIGSGNRFGVPVSVTLKLVTQPEASHTFLFHTPSLEEAMQVAKLLGQSLHTIEMLVVFRTNTTFGWHLLLVLTGYSELVLMDKEAVLTLICGLDPQLQDLNASDKVLNQWIQKLDGNPSAEVLLPLAPTRVTKQEVSPVFERWQSRLKAQFDPNQVLPC